MEIYEGACVLHETQADVGTVMLWNEGDLEAMVEFSDGTNTYPVSELTVIECDEEF